MEWREANGLRWLETRMPGATAAFTTRAGGVSDPPFDELNLGVFTDDDRDAVIENRRRLAAALGFAPDRIAIAHQIHGAGLIAHSSPTSLRCSFASYEGGEARRKLNDEGIPDADGHLVAEPEMAALVFVADCVPVALAGPESAAMLHCGWRGLAAGIISQGVKATGATDAAIGPSIGRCCYEVGKEVLDAFGALGDGIATDRMLDLPEVALRLLREQGVERIEASGLCTCCEPDLFFSHRRDAGRSGRQAGLVWLDRESG
ncbi:MAG: purine-nucleoside/S-methyl-5-thioadenosine phosphorylase / adenosine deaminase [Solirubrobacterales bacterium]|jgi:YfiH family protein|nr:purine-nucleoside/S-methyl-5-thioadenosine phosphorylase / adenosine deaminase [Solirubrobacterales bacterium]